MVYSTRYDRAANKFTHFRHTIKDAGSLSNDSVSAILQDRSGNLWIGTYGGLDLFNPKTNTFTHYANKLNDAASLSSNHIRVIYEDRQGTLWVGCGGPFKTDKETPEQGGLNRLDKHSGKFIRYLHDPNNPNSIANNKVRAILEDSKGNFWVGTAGDGLHTLNRNNGVFTHYYYDSTHPEKLSRPPILSDESVTDFISFIHEDAKGCIWISGFQEGINQYDPTTKKLIHHGYKLVQNKVVADTLSGFNDNYAWWAFSSKDGLLWICTSTGNAYTVSSNPKPVIPYVALNVPGANTFYEDKKGSLWISTDSGLIRKDTITGKVKRFLHDPGNKHSLSNNTVNVILADSEGKFWLGTDGGGLDRFDPLSETFTHYTHDDTKKGSLSSNRIWNLYFDHKSNLWIATGDSGLNMLDIKTGFFTTYKHDSRDINSVSNDRVYCMVDDENEDLWIGTNAGVNRLNKKSGRFQHYMLEDRIKSVLVDNENVLWAGGVKGLYRYDRKGDRFLLYEGNGGLVTIKSVLHIIEDDEKNLWVSTTDAIYKIGADRNTVRIYGNEYGVHTNNFLFANNYKTKSGKFAYGRSGGLLCFFPCTSCSKQLPAAG